MMKYEVFEHTADIGLQIYGSSLKELFENAGIALFELMADLSAVKAVETVEVSAKGDNIEELFMAWLRELLYIFHGRRYLLKEFEVMEMEKGSIKGIARGERIYPGRHLMRGEVKGATYHRLEVKEIDGKWEAKVILDV